MQRFLRALFILLSLPAAGASYFVATTGNDTTGDGSVGNPWATCAKAISHGLVAGDIVNVAAGIYTERVVPTTSGSSGNLITFNGAWDSTGTNCTVTNAGFQIGDVGAQVNYIKVAGFAAVNRTTYSGYNEPACSGFYLSSIGSKLLTNNAFNCSQAGIFVESRTSATISQQIDIIGNTCWSNGLNGIYPIGSNINLYYNAFGKSFLSNNLAGTYVSAVTIASGGTGYQANDILTVAGGTFTTAAQLKVDTVSGGVITAIHVANQGIYQVNAASPNSPTGGHGTGASINLTFVQFLLSDADAAYPLGWTITIRSNYIISSNYQDAQNGGPTRPSWGCHCDGIQTWGPAAGNPMGYTTNLLIEDNYIDQSQGNGAGFYGEQFNTVMVRNNVILAHKGISGNSGWTNMIILNNTMIGNTNEPLASTANGINIQNGYYLTNLNNIIFDFLGEQVILTGDIIITSGNNIEYVSSFPNPASLSENTSYDPYQGNDYWGTNPSMVGPYSSPANFQLQSSGWSVDHGKDIPGILTNDIVNLYRPQRSSTDIGAYEFVGDIVITQQPQPTTVVQAFNATFTVAASGSSTVHYQWKFNGSNVGTDSSSYTRVAVQGTDTGLPVTCHLSNLSDALDTDPAILTVTLSAFPGAVIGNAKFGHAVIR